MNKRVSFVSAIAVGVTIGWISNNKLTSNGITDPIVIIGGILAIVGLVVLIGRYLNNKDIKKGYCPSGTDEGQEVKDTPSP